MKKYLLYFLNIIVVFQFTACDIGDDTSTPTRDLFTFAEEYDMTNVKKTYQTDDFIFIRYNSDKMMTESTTGETLMVGNATMFPTIDVLGPLDGSLEGQDKFEYSLLDGLVIEGDNEFSEEGYLKLNIGCPENLDYQTEINLQFPQPGGFVIFLDFEAESIFHSFPFTADENCTVVAPGNISDAADIGNVQFFFNVADTNLDEFEKHITDLETQSIPVANEAVLRSALEEKRAFFVLVE